MQVISVYVLSGIDAPQTIRVVDLIKMLIISVLINCGSTRNFIYEPIAKRLRLSVIDATPFSVGIADKNQMTSAGTCQLSLATSGHMFDVTVSLLTLKGVVIECD